MSTDFQLCYFTPILTQKNGQVNTIDEISDHSRSQEKDSRLHLILGKSTDSETVQDFTTLHK
jgi:hypothetical protein